MKQSIKWTSVSGVIRVQVLRQSCLLTNSPVWASVSSSAGRLFGLFFLCFRRTKDTFISGVDVILFVRFVTCKKDTFFRNKRTHLNKPYQSLDITVTTRPRSWPVLKVFCNKLAALGCEVPVFQFPMCCWCCHPVYKPEATCTVSWRCLPTAVLDSEQQDYSLVMFFKVFAVQFLRGERQLLPSLLRWSCSFSNVSYW